MIVLENVTKVFPGGVTALRGVSLTVAKGEFAFLVGPNGAGKSTLLDLIYGEQAPTSGTVRVFDIDLARLPPARLPYFRRQIGMIFQDFKLLADRTALENISFALETIDVARGQITTKALAALEAAGLAGKASAFPDELSAGEQQRVALARALAKDPLLLLADEPTGNIDEAGTRAILELLTRVNAQGTTIVLSTHDATLATGVTGRVIRLAAGGVG